MKIRLLMAAFVSFLILLGFASFCSAQTTSVPPKDLIADVENNAVTLSWATPIGTSVAGFNIYRKEDKLLGKYEKINPGLLTATTFSDKSISKGKSYLYVCRSVNADGLESADSNASGAPKMEMKASAAVTHMNRPVRIASPGDVIKYNIDFANQGYGVARNVVIVYAIPKGTTFISGTARCQKYKVTISYFDEKAGKWSDKVSKEENISKVSFKVLEDVYPAVKDKNDIASLKVMVNY